MTEEVQRSIGEVRVAELGSVPNTVPIFEGDTVGSVLSNAGIAAPAGESLDIRLNGSQVTMEQPVSDQDTIVSLPKIRGGIS